MQKSMTFIENSRLETTIVLQGYTRYNLISDFQKVGDFLPLSGKMTTMI